MKSNSKTITKFNKDLDFQFWHLIEIDIEVAIDIIIFKY